MVLSVSLKPSSLETATQAGKNQHDAARFIQAELTESLNHYQAIMNDAKLQNTVADVAETCTACLQSGGTVFFAGNGGSAADAQHLAAELAGRMNYDRPGLAGVALTANTSNLTAIGNDYGFDTVYSRQLAGIGKTGDVFVGISTSGNSVNIIKAMEVARSKGVTTVSMTGSKACTMDSLADYALKMPSTRTPKIQEGHIAIGHILMGLIELAIYPEHAPKG